MNRAISWNRIGCRAPALVLAAFLVGCAATGPSSPAAQQAADLVLLNGKIVTVDRDFSIKQAVAIKDGKFLAVGSNDEIRRFAAPNTRTIDLKGRTVLPGLFDSHTHV